MSKVYSFRLSDNNPREAQAKEVIEVWVFKGYSLRHIIIEALVSFHKSAHQNNELEEILGKITNLLEAMNNGGESVKFVQETFPGAFVESLSKSVKSGMKIK